MNTQFTSFKFVIKREYVVCDVYTEAEETLEEQNTTTLIGCSHTEDCYRITTDRWGRQFSSADVSYLAVLPSATQAISVHCSTFMPAILFFFPIDT